LSRARLSGQNSARKSRSTDVAGLGTLRVAEHLTVRDGKIARIRQIYGTHALREAGFVG
jgi:hypothetical protein